MSLFYISILVNLIQNPYFPAIPRAVIAELYTHVQDKTICGSIRDEIGTLRKSHYDLYRNYEKLCHHGLLY